MDLYPRRRRIFNHEWKNKKRGLGDRGQFGYYKYEGINGKEENIKKKMKKIKIKSNKKNLYLKLINYFYTFSFIYYINFSPT